MKPRPWEPPELRALRVIATAREVDAADVALAMSITKAAAHGRLLRACREGVVQRIALGRYRAAG